MLDLCECLSPLFRCSLPVLFLESKSLMVGYLSEHILSDTGVGAGVGGEH